jgi:hypothetical protein
VRGDIGGFGVGSEFSWNLLGAYGWQIAARNGVTYAGIVGYRLLSVDYQKGSGGRRSSLAPLPIRINIARM